MNNENPFQSIQFKIDSDTLLALGRYCDSSGYRRNKIIEYAVLEYLGNRGQLTAELEMRLRTHQTANLVSRIDDILKEDGK